MSKQNIPQYLKRAIWEAYKKKSGYEDIPILFSEMEIDHIIPERVILNPKEKNEFLLWKVKYDLNDAFNIHSIENLCPSTRDFNLMKSDKGLYDEADAYKKYIIRALIKAKELAPKIKELGEKIKKNLATRNANSVTKLINLVEEGKIELRYLILDGIKVDYTQIGELEEFEKYNIILSKYRTQRIIYYNFGEYCEVRSAARYSQYKKTEDLAFWLDILEDFLSNIPDSKLKNNVFYELAFAMFKAGKSWKPIEVQLIEYFNSMGDEKNLEILQQSAVLFNIFYGEFQRGRVDSSIDKVFELREFLLNNLIENIELAKTQARKANLKNSAFLIRSSLTRDELLDRDPDANKKWVKRYFQNFIQLLDIIENVKFFDFSGLYKDFTRLADRIEYIKEFPDYDEFHSRIATLKNKYEGNNSTIEDLMSRGIELYNNRQYFKAIRQFQNVKNISFNPDKLYTCLFSVYYIGECYKNLELYYAAKYYFMLVFYLAEEIDAEYNIKQLTYNCGADRVAALNYFLNNGLEAVYFTSISIILREFYSLEGFNLSLEKNNNMYALIENAMKNLAYSKQKSENIKDIIGKYYEILDLLNFLEEGLNKLNFSYSKDDVKKIEDKYGFLFKDAINPRQFSWSQLGVKWTITWENNFLSTALAEEFIAYTQIFLSTIEDIDILSAEDVVLKLKPSNRFYFTNVNREKIIEVLEERDKDYFPKFFTIIFQLLFESFIVSKDQIMEKIKPLLEIGYFSNYYADIYKKFIHTDLFETYHQINGVLNE